MMGKACENLNAAWFQNNATRDNSTGTDASPLDRTWLLYDAPIMKAKKMCKELQPPLPIKNEIDMSTTLQLFNQVTKQRCI